MLENDNKSDSEIFANLEEHRNKVSTLRTHKVPTKKTIETISSKKQGSKPNDRIAAEYSPENPTGSSGTNIFLSIIILALIASSVCYYSVKNIHRFKNEIFLQARQVLRVIVRTEAQHIENFIEQVLGELRLLGVNPRIQQALIEGRIASSAPDDIASEALNIMHDNLITQINAIYVIGTDGTVISRAPFANKPDDGYSDILCVKTILETHKPCVSDFFVTDFGKSISVCSPVFKEGELIGMLRAFVNLDAFRECLNNSTIDNRGCTFMLDNNGMLISHPSKEFIGITPLEYMKDAYPEHDWSAATKVHSEMTSGKEGFATYKSLYWRNDKLTLTKCLSVYTPVKAGDKTWTISTNLDYDEISTPVLKHARNIYTGAFLLIAGVIGTGLVLYKSLRTKIRLKLKVQSEEELRSVNQQLQTEILDRINAQESLAQERNLLHGLMNAMPDQLTAKNRKGEFVFRNPASLEGLPETPVENIIGKTAFDFYSKENAAKWRDEKQEILKTGQGIFNREVNYIDAKGEKNWALSSKVPWHDAEGKIIGFITVSRNITERKKAEEDLANERNLLRTLIEALPDHIYAKDLQSNFVFANESCANHLGASNRKDVIGKSDAQYLSKEMALFFRAEEQKIINTGVSIINRNSISRNPAHQAWGLITKVPWKNAKGKIIGIIGVNRNTTTITERKKAEENLANERNLLRTLIEAIPDSVYAKDFQGNFVFANESCASELGLSNPKDVIGKSDFHYMPKEMALSFRDEEQKIINTGISIINSESVSHNPIKQTWGLITKVPWKNTKGKIIGIIGVNRDISKIKMSQEKQAILLEVLEEKNWELESVVRIANHDLRTPLVNIDGFSHILDTNRKEIESIVNSDESDQIKLDKIKAITTDDISVALDIILASSVKMRSLLDGLSQLAKLGFSATQIEKIDMNITMAKIVKTMQYLADQTNCEISVEKLPYCHGDKSQINQVFSNLIGNAIKYLDPSRHGVIKITGWNEGDDSIYCVEDNGMGVDPAQLGDIFKLFYRLDTEDYKGEGIGLSIVRRIVTRHHGKAWAESCPGKGSKFFVQLPTKNKN
ncbi:MAG: PAS domain-containing protein [Planctomycetes bacterium]|nr:PAS domain-containing protein [Planctomycetota bacterium]